MEQSSTSIPTVVAADTSAQASTPAVAASTAASAQVAAVPAASVAAPNAIGTISAPGPGAEIIRGGQRIPVIADEAVLAGDRIVVPQGMDANMKFVTAVPGEAPVTAVVKGGTDAVLNLKPPVNGLQEVAVDLASGDILVNATDVASDASKIIVKKAAAGLGLADLGLAALAAGALMALGNNGGDDSPAPTPVPTPAPTPAPTAAPSAGVPLLDPSQNLLTQLPQDSSGAPLNPVLTGAAPVLGAVDSVAKVLNSATAPLLGGEFNPANTGMLDPLDSLVATLAGTGLKPVLDPVLTPLAGAGQANNVVHAVATQVDFVTDGLEHLLGANPLTNLANSAGLNTSPAQLSALAAQGQALATQGQAGLASLGDALMGLTSAIPSPTAGTDALLSPAQQQLAALPNMTNGLPLDPLANGLTPVLDGASTVAGALNSATAPLLGGSYTPNNPGVLDPVDSGVASGVHALQPVLAPVLTPVLGAGAANTLGNTLVAQVDYATDGVQHLLGGAALPQGLPGLPLSVPGLPGAENLTALLPTAALPAVPSLPTTGLPDAAMLTSALAPLSSVLGANGASPLAPLTDALKI